MIKLFRNDNYFVLLDFNLDIRFESNITSLEDNLLFIQDVSMLFHNESGKVKRTVTIQHATDNLVCDAINSHLNAGLYSEIKEDSIQINDEFIRITKCPIPDDLYIFLELSPEAIQDYANELLPFSFDLEIDIGWLNPEGIITQDKSQDKRIYEGNGIKAILETHDECNLLQAEQKIRDHLNSELWWINEAKREMTAGQKYAQNKYREKIGRPLIP